MNKAFLLLATAAFATAAMAQDATPAMPGNAPMQQTPAPGTPATTPDTMPAPAPMAPPSGDSTTPAPMPMAGSAMPATTTASADYPTCSRTVMDKCVQKGAISHKAKKHG